MVSLRRAAGQEGRKALLFCLACFFISRLLVLGAAYAVFYSCPDPPAPPGYESQGPLDRRPLNVLFFYDAVHYLRIAREGYSLPEAPWFPLYPLLVRALGGTAASAVALSNACFFLALVALYRLGGRGAVLLACASPVGVVFSAAYSESLFFCLAAWFLVFLEEGRLLPAGVLAGLAALCRAPGWALAGALALHALRGRNRDSLLAAVLAAALGALWPLYQLLAFGDPLLSARVNAAVFSRRLMPPWWGTWHDLVGLTLGKPMAAGPGIVLLNLLGWLWLGASLVPGVPGRAGGLLYALLVLSLPVTRRGYVHAAHGLLRYACAWPGGYLGLARALRTRAGTLLVAGLSLALAVLSACLVACKVFLF